MKLKELQNVLMGDIVVLFTKYQKPLPFEMVDGLEYRFMYVPVATNFDFIDKVEEETEEGDTMFKLFGDYEIECIYGGRFDPYDDGEYEEVIFIDLKEM